MQYYTTRAFPTASRQYEAGDAIDPAKITAAEWISGTESGAVVPARWYGTAAELAARGIPGPGVPVYETDTTISRVGDGVTAVASLPIAGSGTFAPITGSAIYAQLGLGATGLVAPSHLRRWRAALADALTTPAVIAVEGDSITVGVGSDNSASGSGSDATYRAAGWVGQLRSLFAQSYGDPGEGFFGSAGVDNGARWIYAGGAVEYKAAGPFKSGAKASNASQTITVPTAACTQVDFWTWDGGGDGSATASYNVDGAGAVTFNAGNGYSDYAGWTKRSITGLANTTHTVVFTGPAAGNGLYLIGVEAIKQATGVRVHRLAKSGSTTANHVGTDADNLSAVQKQRLMNALAVVPAANLLIVSLGTNDFGNQNATSTTLAIPGATPTQYAANLQLLVDTAVGHGACVLLVGEPRTVSANYPSPMTYTEQNYYDQAAAIAAATDHVAFVDIGSAWGGTRSAADAIGGMTISGSVHPARPGHGDMARLVHRVLTLPNLA